MDIHTILPLLDDNKHFPSKELQKDNTVVSSLEIVFIEPTDEEVNYTCVGYNSEGRHRDSVKIKVLGNIDNCCHILNILIL